MTIEDDDIIVPLGDDRTLVIQPTENPDEVNVYFYGKRADGISVLPRSSNSIVLRGEVAKPDRPARRKDRR